MLSQDLQSLKTWFEATRLPGNVMSDEAADAFAAALGVAVESARQLEHTSIAPAGGDAFDLTPETGKLIRTARALAGAANVVMLHAAFPLQVVDAAPLDGGAA